MPSQSRDYKAKPGRNSPKSHVNGNTRWPLKRGVNDALLNGDTVWPEGSDVCTAAGHSTLCAAKKERQTAEPK
jgi:hypothetical protein